MLLLYPGGGRIGRSDMLAATFNPIKWIGGHIPRSRAQLEVEAKNLLKVVFWVALLAPVVLLPAYYLVLALLR